ncbi:hypothetical protein [Paenibacillus whitsoniae]|nr:hypothetical protein [Paenibacillus whitsoniae]
MMVLDSHMPIERDPRFSADSSCRLKEGGHASLTWSIGLSPFSG